MASNRQLFDLSLLTIIKFFLVLLSLVFLYVIRDIAAVLFVALVFAAAISPGVDYLERKKVPRSVSAIFFFLILFSFIAFSITLLIPMLMEQVSALSRNLPAYTEKLNVLFADIREFTAGFGGLARLNQTFTLLESELTKSVGTVFGSILNIFGGLVWFVAVVVITFYLLAEKQAVKRAAAAIIPEKYQDFFIQLVYKIQTKISAWLKGQLFLSLIVGLLVYAALLILGVEYALILALVAFIGEFVPYLGPILASLPAIFVALASSPLKAVFVLIIYVLIQQAENHVLVPKIMQRAVGLNPIVSILAMLIGAKIIGFWGVLLAIPAATAISVIIKEFYRQKSDSESRPE